MQTSPIKLSEKLQQQGITKEAANTIAEEFRELAERHVANPASKEDVENAKRELQQDMKLIEQKLASKIDSVEQKLEAKIDAVEQKLESKIEKLDIKIDVMSKNLLIKLGSLIAGGFAIMIGLLVKVML